MRTTPAILIAGLALAGCQSMSTPMTREKIVATEPRCADATVPIYFEANSAEVPREGMSLLKAGAEQLKACTVKSVSVVGLADAVGSPEANLELSKRRVQAVEAALMSVGLPAAEFDAAAVGSSGAVTADGRAAPLRRRAEITVRVEPKR